MTSTANASAAMGAAAADTIAGAWIVELSPGVQDLPGTAARLTAQSGGRVRFTYKSAVHGFAVENLPPQAAAALARNPVVARMEPDRIFTADGTQSPPPSWGLDRIDQAALPLNSTYSYANAGAGVTAYILDTGFDTTIRTSRYPRPTCVRASRSGTTRWVMAGAALTATGTAPTWPERSAA